MISKAFKRLKRRSGAVELERLRHSLGFQSGKHKRKRLCSGGREETGKTDDSEFGNSHTASGQTLHTISEGMERTV